MSPVGSHPPEVMVCGWGYAWQPVPAAKLSGSCLVKAELPAIGRGCRLQLLSLRGWLPASVTGTPLVCLCRGNFGLKQRRLSMSSSSGFTVCLSATAAEVAGVQVCGCTNCRQLQRVCMWASFASLQLVLCFHTMAVLLIAVKRSASFTHSSTWIHTDVCHCCKSQPPSFQPSSQT